MHFLLEFRLRFGSIFSQFCIMLVTFENNFSTFWFPGDNFLMLLPLWARFGYTDAKKVALGGLGMHYGDHFWTSFWTLFRSIFNIIWTFFCLIFFGQLFESIWERFLMVLGVPGASFFKMFWKRPKENVSPVGARAQF